MTRVSQSHFPAGHRSGHNSQISLAPFGSPSHLSVRDQGSACYGLPTDRVKHRVNLLTEATSMTANTTPLLEGPFPACELLTYKLKLITYKTNLLAASIHVL